MAEDETQGLKMTPEIRTCFEDYQQARVDFVESISEIGDHLKHIETLVNGGVLEILQPLLSDNVPSVQQKAALALGKVAAKSEFIATRLVESEVLGQIVLMMQQQPQQSTFQDCSSYLLRSVARHSKDHALAVIKAGAIPEFYRLCTHFDSRLKESGLWALYYLAFHSVETATSVVEGPREVEIIVRCANEPHVGLKRIAICLVTNIVKHGVALAQRFINHGILDIIHEMVDDIDGNLRRQVFAFLAQILKHELDMAESVIQTRPDIVGVVVKLLRSADDFERKNATTCLLSIAKHSQKLARLILDEQFAIVSLVQNAGEKGGPAQWPAIRTIGYIASHDDELRKNVLEGGAIPALVAVLEDAEVEDYFKAAAAWSIGQLSSPLYELTQQILDEGALSKMNRLLASPKSSEDLRITVVNTMTRLIGLCREQRHLDVLLRRGTSRSILEIAIKQLADAIVLTNARQRKAFAQTDGFRYLQVLNSKRLPASDSPNAIPSKRMLDEIRRVNSAYDNRLVAFTTPNYEASLIKLVERQ